MRDADPIVMYLVVRRSLKLTSGKIGAQCGHAVQYLLQSYFIDLDPLLRAKREMTREWLAGDHAKITLGADDQQYELVKMENPEFFKVVDLGYTQVAPDTETALGLWPMRKALGRQFFKHSSRCATR